MVEETIQLLLILKGQGVHPQVAKLVQLYQNEEVRMTEQLSIMREQRGVVPLRLEIIQQ
jgi:hypothetical protein